MLNYLTKVLTFLLTILDVVYSIEVIMYKNTDIVFSLHDSSPPERQVF